MTGYASKIGIMFRRTSILLALTCVAIAGCGKSTPVGTVSGKVTLNDAPYVNADLVFLSLETGQGGTAQIQSDGSFKMTDPLPVGTYKVYLAPKLSETTAEAQPVTIDASVADKYWNEASTDISVTVNEGDNSVDVKLTK